MSASGTKLALDACAALVATVEATGGILIDEHGSPVGCEADPEWMDLAHAARLACEALLASGIRTDLTETRARATAADGTEVAAERLDLPPGQGPDKRQ